MIGIGPAIALKNARTAVVFKSYQKKIQTSTNERSADIVFGGMSMTGKNMVLQDRERIISITFLNDNMIAKAQVRR